MESIAARRSPGHVRPAYGWAVLVYDRLYRYLHGLDTPASEIGLVLRLELRRSRRERRLPDGTVVRRGDRLGILHLNNSRIGCLHASEPSPLSAGLELRREFLASLHALAGLTAPGGPLAEVRAFQATTILHDPLGRLGFAAARDGRLWGWLVAIYQRALLASLHPGARLGRSSYRQARRLWISREALMARFGGGSMARGRWVAPPAA